MKKNKQPNYHAYESQKRNLPKDLTPQEYERRIKEAAKKAGI